MSLRLRKDWVLPILVEEDEASLLAGGGTTESLLWSLDGGKPSTTFSRLLLLTELLVVSELLDFPSLWSLLSLLSKSALTEVLVLFLGGGLYAGKPLTVLGCVLCFASPRVRIFRIIFCFGLRGGSLSPDFATLLKSRRKLGFELPELSVFEVFDSVLI